MRLTALRLSPPRAPRLRGLAATAAATATLAMAGPASAAILVNGGFEAPDRGAGTNYHMIAPSNVPGWSTTDSVIEIWANGFQGVTAYEGDQHAEVNANRVGTLHQDVASVQAGSVLSFGFAHRARQGTDVLRFTLTDLGVDGLFGTGDDTSLFSDTYSATTAGWVYNSSAGLGPITALGNTLRLSFTAVSTGSGNNSVGNFLDAVSLDARVSAVPVPAGVLLLATGLGALGAAGRRRRRG